MSDETALPPASCVHPAENQQPHGAFQRPQATTPQEAVISQTDDPDSLKDTPEADPHARLLSRLRARNAASEVNYRVKSGELP
ncbi:hypothetical protein [Streptomyces sp. NBRC 109706]|uniref:hypothetical protein n=1 Tax=Streptomyces sp. NBRC 109706 TaxID=1550035 RepID=UPI000B2610D5|nr:hypothetical protein [Streptomyces sp. NBRC 109706]